MLNIPILEVAHLLGLRTRNENRKEVEACCPFCQDTHYHMYLTVETNQFICFRCGTDGNSLTLDPDFTRRMLDNLNGELEKAISSSGNQPVILCSSPIRMPFRTLI